MRNPFRRVSRTAPTDPCNAEKKTAMALTDNQSTGCEPEINRIEGRLVVMGNESRFSDEQIEYAVDMARRMSYEILAVNSAPLSCDTFSLFPTSRNKLCQEFKSISENSARTFRDAAESQGVAFNHVVKFDEPEQALSSLQKEYANIEFVISDAPANTAANRVSETERPRNELLVYAMM